MPLNKPTYPARLVATNAIDVKMASHTPNSTGTVGSDDLGSFRSIQYAWNHPHHHHSSTNMIAHINGDNSNSTAGRTIGLRVAIPRRIIEELDLKYQDLVEWEVSKKGGKKFAYIRKLE